MSIKLISVSKFSGIEKKSVKLIVLVSSLVAGPQQ